MIDYSVIIRTTGEVHEKYQKLLDSIEKLMPQPQEIIVVLPEGKEYPKEKTGKERYYFSPEGMVTQRMTGVEKCKTKYALICDDDVCFEPDFVEYLYEPIKAGMCSITVGPLYSFLPSEGIKVFLSALMGSAVPTVFHKERYVSILRTSGYSYNRKLSTKRKYYETQSAAWTCFFAEVDALKKINFMDEIWLEAHGYSYLDDQTMFYKAYLLGIKTMVVVSAEYEHLDARTSVKNKRDSVLYSMNFNRVVFWHRFIYKRQKNKLSKMSTTVCFVYRSIWLIIYHLLNILRRRMTVREFEISCRGYWDGWKYIEMKEYKELPLV